MENSPAQKNSLTVPVAIVLAGALIAVAVYLSNTKAPTSSTAQQNTGQAQTQQAAPANTNIAITPVSSSDHFLGNPSAPLAIVVYTDPECPFCKVFHQTMQQVMSTYGKDGKVAWVYRDFPISVLHPKAPNETHATECAAALGGQTAYWAYIRKIFEITPSNNGLDPAELPKIATQVGLDLQKFNDCQASQKYADLVTKEYNEAVKSGGQGTPYSVFVSSKPIPDSAMSAIAQMSVANNFPPNTFVFSGDKMRMSMSGALPYALVQQIIDLLLQKA